MYVIIAASIGGSVGFLLAAGVSVAILFFYFRRRRANAQSTSETVSVAVTKTNSKPGEGWALIDNIKVQDRIGGGPGRPSVYRGLWNKLTQVALKELFGDDEDADIFRKAHYLQNLQHPNVVQLFGVHKSATTRQSYLVMEYAALGSLDVLVARERRSLHLPQLLAM